MTGFPNIPNLALSSGEEVPASTDRFLHSDELTSSKPLDISSDSLPVSIRPAMAPVMEPLTSNGVEEVDVEVRVDVGAVENDGAIVPSPQNGVKEQQSYLRFIKVACTVTTAKPPQPVTNDRSLWESFGALGTQRRQKFRRTILTDVSGCARSGEVFAIMGASGAGKTTLLDVLARKIVSSRIAGRVELDGQPVTSSLMRRSSAYVRQDDLMYTCLTVRETLRFAAELRMSRKCSKQEKEEKVEHTIDLLGLTKVAGSLIGDEFRRGVSGGERKRVCIGAEIMGDPKVLFLDEPTSGLDSTSAFRVVSVVRDIAIKTNSIAIMVLHQPSFRVLEQIDNLLLLAAGQRLFTGSPRDLPGFFEDFGEPMPQFTNSTEYALDFIEDVQRDEQRLQQLLEFAHKWNADRAIASGDGTNEDLPDGAIPRSGSLMAVWKSVSRGGATIEAGRKPKREGPMFVNLWYRELLVLSWRMFIILRRTPALYLLRLTLVGLTGLLCACLFWHPPQSFTGFQLIVAYFSFALCVLFFSSADVVPIFIQERNIFIRETSHNMYRASTYLVASTVVYIPLQVASALLLVLESWWSIQLAGGVGGFMFLWLIYFLCIFVGSAIAILISVLLNNIILAYTVAITIMAYFVLVCGFYIQRLSFPPEWIWLHYLSPMKYAFEAVMLNQFDRPGPCYMLAGQAYSLTPLAPYVTPEVSEKAFNGLRMLLTDTPYSNITTETCLQDGPLYINQVFAITELNKWECALVLFCYGLAVRFIYYLLLVRFSKSKQK